MSRAMLCLAVLLVASTASCSERLPVPSPTIGRWSLDIQGEDAKAIPVHVVDTSGLVTGARPGQVMAFDVVGRSTVVSIDDVEQELAIEWKADICATGTTITLQSSGAAIVVDVAVASEGSCDLLGYDYSLVLDLSAPIGERPVVVTQDDLDARSWGATLPGSDGRKRPLLVVDRSRRVQSVIPMDPGQLNPGEDGPTVRPGDGETSVIVSWVGDVCDTRADIDVDLDGGLTAVRITVANERQLPCIGQLRFEGVLISFARPVDPGSIHASLVSRH